MEAVLSLFPGLDLLGHAFTEAGFSLLRGPDPLYNSRIEDFHVPSQLHEEAPQSPPQKGPDQKVPEGNQHHNLSRRKPRLENP